MDCDEERAAYFLQWTEKRLTVEGRIDLWQEARGRSLLLDRPWRVAVVGEKAIKELARSRARRESSAKA